MKRYVLIFWLVMTLLVTLTYAAIQGDFVINGVDATVGTKFYRIPASTTYGLRVDVARITGTVPVLITNPSVTINGSVAITNPTITVSGTVTVSTMPTITVVGNQTPSDAFSNPTNAIAVFALPAVFTGTDWVRARAVVTNVDDVAPSSLERIPRTAAYVYGYDGASFDRIRVDSLLTTNSTTTLLNSGITYTGTFTETLGYANITVMVLSNVASATSGVKIQYSSDGTNIDYVSTREYTDNVGAGVVYTVPTRGRYVRVLYTNGGTNQATFRLQSILRVAPSSAAIQEIDTTVGNHVQALVTKSVIIGKTTAGGGSYVDVKVNPSGGLVVDASSDTSPYKVTNSAVITQFTGTTVSTVLSARSTTRSMMLIFNEGGSTLYVALASTAATTAYTYKLQPEAYWEMPYTTYTGTVSGIWSGATATTMVTVY